ncbi:DUF5946 family protein [Streptomyces abyssomicinicus]|nr:DUF5946 family protein [Streptomyces abyssomicinicus]
MEPCAECGAPTNPRSCDELFHALLASDHSRQASYWPSKWAVLPRPRRIR